MDSSMTDQQILSTSPMKQSVSLTSLPPPTSHGTADVSDSSVAKIFIERPYNSLKQKKRSSERDWRNSWGSNQSYSSCSLQSNATNIIGKDDFWLALQPNYNFIMDTNLLDSCREARGELECHYPRETNPTELKTKIGGKPHDEYIVDLKRLRRWLREVEDQLNQFPTVSDAIKMKDFELEKLQKKNSELYRIIASHAKLISACTRTLSRQRDSSESRTSIAPAANVNIDPELQQQELETQLSAATVHDDTADHCYSSLETHTTRRSQGSSNNSTNECNLRGLERRYHSLYLKSFEISLLLENLLAHKNDDFQNSASQSSSSEIDEGPAAKLARFTNDLIAENHQRKTLVLAKRKLYDSSDCNLTDDDDGCRFLPNYFENTVIPVQTNGFDADSEGSDCELSTKMNTVQEAPTNIAYADDNGNPILSVSLGSENNTLAAINNESPRAKSLSPHKHTGTLKRQRKNTMKFNQSNRESDSLGVFYFKHSDTEPETGNPTNNANDWSSQDANSEIYSEDDQWVYSNGNDINGNADGNEADNGDSSPMSNNSNTIDMVDCPMPMDESIHLEKIENGLSSSTPNQVLVQEEVIYSKETIQQLVIGAENLVRDEILSKTPVRYRRQSSDSTNPTRKSLNTLTSSKYKRVASWLQNQGQSKVHAPKSIATNTDGEASFEYTTDSRESDSEGLADSVATTCLPANGNKSGASTEVITSSGDLLKDSPESMHSSVITRTKRRNSERPVSVSCISQLITQKPVTSLSDDANQSGLANHSISESALNTLNVSQLSMRSRYSGSKSSLKKRRLRVKRKQRSESGSNASEGSGSNQRGSILSLNPRSEACSSTTMIKETSADETIDHKSEMVEENDDENVLPKPKFQLGAYTSVVFKQTQSSTLAPLAFYNLNGMRNNELSFTGTEDNSNLSEQQSWDDYQEKYMSEAYSEGRDSDAARKILEFGDDYRNFIDSQSDCCSSLSAANNLDSMSPPRGRKPFASMPITNKPSDDDGAIRYRRTLEKEIERRKRSHAENNRKSWNEDRRKMLTGSETLLSRSSNKSLKPPKTSIGRKLEIEFQKAIFGSDRRRIKTIDPKDMLSSSDDSDAEHDAHVDAILEQSRRDLENTQALRIRRHLLHSEDYTEIIDKCSDNVRCLKTILHSSGGAIVPHRRVDDIRELVSSWESLLDWSENESFVKKSQEEMAALIDKFSKIGTIEPNLDTETAIQFAIQETMDEKAQLHTYRSSMLRLNASVHSWLTRHEKRKQCESTSMPAMANDKINHSPVSQHNDSNTTDGSTLELTVITVKSATDMATETDDWKVDEDLHKQLKNDVGNMYKVWDEADKRVKDRLESLTTSLIAWTQFESGLNEFNEALGKDTGALKRLTGELEMGTNDDTITNNLAHDVKEVAKRLSENQNAIALASAQQATLPQSQSIRLTNGAMPFTLPSNGSLSDSGISDGGCSSDYGLSERERRLGALRRLAKQLEQALPGSEALKSINQRMETAEAELRSLQKTCRELIIRTAAQCPTQSTGPATISATDNGNASNTTIAQHPINFQIPIINVKPKTTKRTTPNKRKQRRRTNSTGAAGITIIPSPQPGKPKAASPIVQAAAPQPDPDDPKDDSTVDRDENKGTWKWRFAKYTFPMQLALIAILCAACFFEPHCCDGINNFTYSFTPQLRYLNGPPPT